MYISRTTALLSVLLVCNLARADDLSGPPPPPPITEIETPGPATRVFDSSQTNLKPTKVPMQRPDLFEGDIANIDPKERNAIKDTRKIWKNGVVPYIISSTFSASERRVISAAIEQYRQNTCIRFVSRTNQRDYVYFQKRSGCFSDVGRSGRSQVVSLGAGCVHVGVVVHEMMHALGFWHEQSRADRDQYVTVHWANIYPGLEYNFQKYTLQSIQHLGEAYDYKSVMHYDTRAFSRDGRSPTITPRRQGVSIGQRRGLSVVDIRKINKLYSCSDGGGVTAQPPTTASPPTSCTDLGGSSCDYWSRSGYCTGTYQSFMSKNCQRSCNLCDSGSSCKDENELCGSWSRYGQCEANPGYMLRFCARSCNQCGSDETSACKNSASDRSCDYWSRIGECNRNPNYMKVYCKKSCSTC